MLGSSDEGREREMDINAQASQVGTGRGVRSSVTMWIVVAVVVVVSMAIGGIATVLRDETTTPSRQVAPSVTVVAPEAPAAGAPEGGSSLGKPQIGSGSASAPGGYVLNGSAQYIPQRQ
jgi:hypothetical protein